MLARHVLFSVSCCAGEAVPNSTPMCRKRLCESSCVRHACVCVTVRVCKPVIQQFVWVGSLFWFLLFFSPFQCFPLLLCSKDKFGRFAKFITFHWWNPPPSPFLNSLLLLPPPPPPGYLCWSVCPLLCASLLFMSEFVMLSLRLGSIHCQVYQRHCTSLTDCDTAFTWSQSLLCCNWRVSVQCCAVPWPGQIPDRQIQKATVR